MLRSPQGGMKNYAEVAVRARMGVLIRVPDQLDHEGFFAGFAAGR